MILLIIGIFNSIHYVVGITAYDEYPLSYGGEERCYVQPAPVEREVQSQESEKEVRERCLEGLEEERRRTKVDDLEKSIAFTTIGLLVFSSHFYFARKTRKEK